MRQMSIPVESALADYTPPQGGLLFSPEEYRQMYKSVRQALIVTMREELVTEISPNIFRNLHSSAGKGNFPKLAVPGVA